MYKAEDFEERIKLYTQLQIQYKEDRLMMKFLEVNYAELTRDRPKKVRKDQAKSI